MRNLKRFLALTLSMLMIVGCFSAVSAKKFADATDSDYAEAIDVLSNVGVICGFDEDTFAPDENVERWMMALMFAKLWTGDIDCSEEGEWKVETNQSQFKDIEEYQYMGSINYCANLGIIKGTSATTFDPTANITYQDALTMAVRALGFGSEKLDAGYPWAYISAATKMGLTNDIAGVKYEEAITRAEAAQIMYNAAKLETATGFKVFGKVFQIGTVIIEETEVHRFGGELVEVQYVDRYGYAHEVGDMLPAIDRDEYYLDAASFPGAKVGDSYVVYTNDMLETVIAATPCTKTYFTEADVTKGEGNAFSFKGTSYLGLAEGAGWTYVSNNKYTKNEARIYELNAATYDDKGNYTNEEDRWSAITGPDLSGIDYQVSNFNSKAVKMAGWAYDDDCDGLYDRFVYVYQPAAATKITATAKSFEKVTATTKVVDNLNHDLVIEGTSEKVEGSNISGLVTGYSATTIEIDGKSYTFSDQIAKVLFDCGSIDTIAETLGKYLSFTLDNNGKLVGVYNAGDKMVLIDNLVAYTAEGLPMYLAYVDGVKTTITVASVDGIFYQAYTLPSTSFSYQGAIAKDARDFIDEAFALYGAVVDEKGYYHLYDNEFDYFANDMTDDFTTAVDNAIAHITGKSAYLLTGSEKLEKGLAALSKAILTAQKELALSGAFVFFDNAMYPIGTFFTGKGAIVDIPAIDFEDKDGNVEAWTFMVRDPFSFEIAIKTTAAEDFSAILIYNDAKIYVDEAKKLIYVDKAVFTGSFGLELKAPVVTFDTAVTTVSDIVYVDADVIASEAVSNKVGDTTILGYAYTYATPAFSMLTGKYVEVKVMPNCRLEAGKFYSINNGYVEKEVIVGDYDRAITFGKVEAVNKYFSLVISEFGKVPYGMLANVKGYNEATLRDKDKDGNDIDKCVINAGDYVFLYNGIIVADNGQELDRILLKANMAARTTTLGGADKKFAASATEFDSEDSVLGIEWDGNFVIAEVDFDTYNTLTSWNHNNILDGRFHLSAAGIDVGDGSVKFNYDGTNNNCTKPFQTVELNGEVVEGVELYTMMEKTIAFEYAANFESSAQDPFEFSDKVDAKYYVAIWVGETGVEAGDVVTLSYQTKGINFVEVNFEISNAAAKPIIVNQLLGDGTSILLAASELGNIDD